MDANISGANERLAAKCQQTLQQLMTLKRS
jgi:hypothetical protein